MDINRRKLLTLMAVAPTLLKQAFAEASATLDDRNPIATYGQSVFYDIYRKKKKIGQHTVQFTKTDSDLRVNIESKITVTVLKVPVFRFNYQSNETWVDGRLQRVKAATDNNGKKHQVSAKRTGDDMLLTDKKGETTTAKVAYSSNHWNSNVVTADKMFNTLTGEANDIVFKNVGVETITMSNDAKTEIEASHYQLVGKVETEVWYDNAGRWVKLRFKGEDGNFVEYRCKGFNA